jgi:hypothetical protein
VSKSGTHARGGAALALTVANLAAGILNYLFLVHAAAVLDAAAFGLLSAWLARVTLLGVIATVVQFLSLDSRLDEQRWTKVLRASGAVSLLLVVVHVVAGPRAPFAVLGASSVIGGILLYAVIGQLQARLLLGVMAASVLGMTALRFALPFAWPREGRAPAFYVAHAAAAFAGIATAALVVTLRRASASTAALAPPAADRRVRLGRPVLLAFATVLFPLLDVLVVSAAQDAATTGAFSRVGLAARIVFFGGAAALQVLLPHQLHAAATGEAMPVFVQRLERWLTPMMLGGALVLALLVHLVLRPSGEERTWLFATCLAAALLVAILGHVNRLAARGSLRMATLCVAGVVLTSALAAALALLGGPEPVTRYSLGVLAGDALVLLAAAAAQMRSRLGSGLR